MLYEEGKAHSFLSQQLSGKKAQFHQQQAQQIATQLGVIYPH